MVFTSAAELERLAFSEPDAVIVFDRFENVATLVLAGITYMAALPPAVAS